MECEWKQILTWSSDSRCLGEIRQLGSPLLPVWSVLSVNCVNIRKIELWNINLFCELTVVIPQLPCLFNMAKAVSSTVVLVNLETADSVNSFFLSMYAFAMKCFTMELVTCSDGWRRSWWQTIHMIPGLPVYSFPQCKLTRQEGACLELLHPMGCFEPTFIETQQTSNMICNVRWLNSWIKTRSFLKDIITSSNEVFIDWESDMVVAIWRLCKFSSETVKSYIIVE